jgi:predicted naringenin-chalcone synthase
MSVRRSAALATKALALDNKESTRLQAMARLSGVRIRHGVVFDHSADPETADAPFYTSRSPGAPQSPTTAERMDVYAREAPRLAAQAAQHALQQEHLKPSDIEALVAVSCTGFFSPGLDYTLVRDLGLSKGIQRVWVGFMGCHGALNGFAAARDFALARPGAPILLVSVELCSLHYQFHLDRDSLVSNFLFADGAAAVVIRAESDRPHPPLQLLDTASHYFPASADAMTWHIGDSGFHMTLDKTVPDLIARALPAVMESFLARHHLHIRDVIGWAIHPGGPRILDASAKALGLSDSHTECSREILRNHGNMSSSTILFLIKRWMERAATGPLVALAFGPGLVAEMALLRANPSNP